MEVEDIEAIGRIRKHVVAFMKTCAAEDIVPEASKVVVVESSLSLRVAFLALLENGCVAAPVWDSARRCYVGVLSPGDFADVAAYFLSKSGGDLRVVSHALEHHKVQVWTDIKAMVIAMGNTVTGYHHGFGMNVSELSSATSASGLSSIGSSGGGGMGGGSRIEPDQESVERACTSMFADADDSLYNACRILRDHSMERVPIVASKEQLVLYILTHLSVLHFVYVHVSKYSRSASGLSLAAGSGLNLAGPAGNPQMAQPNTPQQTAQQPGLLPPGSTASSLPQLDGPELLDLTMEELQIGTFMDLATTTYSEPIRRAIELMSQRRISAIPVVDEHGMILDEYTREDACQLVQDVAAINLDMCVADALRTFRVTPIQVSTCRRSDTLRQIFERFEGAQAYRLYFVSNRGALEGVISLSDLLGYFLE